jgi:ankyrin repeat protein
MGRPVSAANDRAARAGAAPFVELLLAHGALVDLPSKEGVTPLMAAAGVEVREPRDARAQP